MKFLLTAIGSKYIHCNLAVHSLRGYAVAHGAPGEVEVAEYTINQQPEDILADIYHRRPDAVGFSCYIWNISLVQRLAEDLHSLLPQVEIWLGGPEVSWDAFHWVEKMPWIRGVMVGEGEKTFHQLMQYYHDERAMSLEEIPGLVFTKALEPKEPAAESSSVAMRFLPEQTLQVYANELRQPMDLSELPFVYEYMGETEHKIVYYESSRGCPFSCSYCLSSIDKKLRFRDWSLVERELAWFLEKKVPQVKFVDRTFNCSHEHAQKIWRYLKEHDNGITNFHFEVSADLLNEAELELLSSLRPGLVQLEIGVQSVNPHTLQEIRRTMNLERLASNVSRLRQAGNIHLHLDLIAGLPWEDLDSFARSFDWVYGLQPEALQLGFLKVLRGTFMEEKQQEYGLLCGSQPPYEVLKTRWLSYEDLCHLKKVEKVLEIYYNSGQFVHTIKRLGQCYDSSFAMYEDLAAYYEEQGLFARQTSRQERFAVLLEFIQNAVFSEGKYPNKGKNQQSFEKVKACGVAWRELLVYDYYLRENAKARPAWAPDQKALWPQITQWYAHHSQHCEELEQYAGYPYRQLLNMTHAEVLPEGFAEGGQPQLILFDYQRRDPLTGNAYVWAAEEFIL